MADGYPNVLIDPARVAMLAYKDHSLGARFWGQVRGFSGRLRVFRGRGAMTGETSQIAGKARA
jgi:hypothetical protein